MLLSWGDKIKTEVQLLIIIRSNSLYFTIKWYLDMGRENLMWDFLLIFLLVFKNST